MYKCTAYKIIITYDHVVFCDLIYIFLLILSIIQQRPSPILQPIKTMHSSKQNPSDRPPKSTKLLDIYIRNNKKQALLIHSPSPTNLNHITTAVARRFRVPPQSQVLFYNGQQLNTSSESQIKVQDKAIVHLVDRRRITDNITINIRRLNLARIQQHRIPSSQIIQDFIVRSIRDQQAHRMFLVHSGRQLNSKRSFAQQMVEDQSQLFCLHQERDQVSQEKREKYQKKMRNRSRQVQVKPQVVVRSPKAKVQSPSQSKNIKIQSYDNESQAQVMTPNFKKKKTAELSFGSNNENYLNPGNINSQQQNQSQSLIAQPNPQANRSSQAENMFFNQGSSISEIVNESVQNPEARRGGQENSLMFHSAIMGLNNQGASNVQLHSRVIHPPEESSLEKQSQDGSFSINFDTRAPQMMPVDRQFTSLQREDIIQVDESKQDTFSNYRDQQSRSRLQDSRQHNEQLNNFSLQNVQNHQLTDSCELRALNSSSKNKQPSMILVDQPNHQQQPLIQDKIKQSSQISHKSSSLKDIPKQNIFSRGKNSSLAEETPKQVDLYIIQNSQGGSQICSDILAKEEVETNGRGSSSNFHSRQSSQARDNQYGFGQFNKADNPNAMSDFRSYNKTDNPNRMSDFRQYNNRQSDLDCDIDVSKSENNYQPQPRQNYRQIVMKQYDSQPQQQQKINNSKQQRHEQRQEQRQESFQAFEVPSQAKFCIEPSSVLKDQYPDKSESNLLLNIDYYEPQEVIEKQKFSQIQGLNQLCSQIQNSDGSKRTEAAVLQFKRIFRSEDLKQKNSSQPLKEQQSSASIVQTYNGLKNLRSFGLSQSIKQTEVSHGLQKMQLTNSNNPFKQLVCFQSEQQFKKVNQLTAGYTLNDLMYECKFAEEDPLLVYLNYMQNQCLEQLS